MKLDFTLMDKNISMAGLDAHRYEASGFSNLWATETGVDPFLLAGQAISGTTTVGVGTAVAIAFARNPMSVAYSAWNLAQLSEGRFTLGLGTQVRAHIQRRYSMPWNSPVRMLREFVLAIRAIIATWRDGRVLDFHGEFYNHDLMAPFWEPSKHDYQIPIYLAAVGPRMTELAGEVADGVLLHSFTTPEYISNVSIPALLRGREKAGLTMETFDVSVPLMMVMGDNEEQLTEMKRKAKRQIAFYGSTPSYKEVFAGIGLEDLQVELAELARRQDWETLYDQVDDDVLANFSVTGTPEQMPGLARAHLGHHVRRTSSYFGWPDFDTERLKAIVADFGSA